MKKPLLFAALLATASSVTSAANEATNAQTVLNLPAEGSVTPEQGLQACYSIQEHTNDMLTWGVAGMPCPAN